MDAREAQLQRELQADAEAAAERLRSIQAQTALGDTNVPRARAFIARAHNTVQQALDTIKEERVVGVGVKYKSWLRALPSDVAALIAIQETIQECMKVDRVALIQSVAARIGRLYETEVRIREAERVNPMYMQKVMDRIDAAGTKSSRHIRNAVNKAYDVVMKGELDSTLSNTEAIMVGRFGLHAVIQAGIVEVVHTKGRKGVLVHLVLAPEVMTYLTGADQGDVQWVMSASDSAMSCPPDPWEGTDDGGYLSVRRKKAAPLLHLHKVRPSMRQPLRDRFSKANMPMVFHAANYLQAVPYSVHAPTAEALLRVWENGGGAMGIPLRQPPAAPDFPYDADFVVKDATEEEAAIVREWKIKKAIFYTARKQWGGRVREIAGLVRCLRNVKERLWFPVHVDSRGRWYYRGAPNPQGSDISKAVLHLGNKKPLGPQGVFWLKVGIANAYGFDKARVKARAAWVDEHWANIEAALDDPENHPDVWGTDSPWCMFTIAWELREAYRSGDPSTYRTGVVIHQDASCSGLQHFSALLRDPIGGKYVNLVDSGGEFKEDIYSKVAELALLGMRNDLMSTCPKTRAAAAHWIKVGIPRSLAKKPVMTYTYGATLHGTADYVAQFVYESPEHAPQEHVSSSLMYVAKKLLGGVANTVPSAAALMQWLREVAREHPRGSPMLWDTPSGFRVYHDYRDYTEKRIKVRSSGVLDLTVRNFTDDTRPHQMQNAVSPNFVHALDGTHMTFVANGCSAEGIDLVAIHDSFGTHPSDVSRLGDIVRRSFVTLYSDSNILSKFLGNVGGSKTIPGVGTLDLSEVLRSEFFTS